MPSCMRGLANASQISKLLPPQRKLLVVVGDRARCVDDVISYKEAASRIFADLDQRTATGLRGDRAKAALAAREYERASKPSAARGS
jgi:hypothetical protein